MARFNYSELVDALQDGDRDTANTVLSEVMPRLVDYLEVVMNADKRTAKECVQQACLDVFEQIHKDKIRNSKYIFSYLIKSVRNEYIRYTKYQHRFSYSEDSLDHIVEPEQQFENLVEEDRQRILKECLEELGKKNKRFILYIFEYPDATTKALSRQFKLSEANVRTKKSRIISRLHDCYKLKSDDDVTHQIEEDSLD
ncbi:MAG TPA: sigma-70 family RNA polymerase sigma factor [Balneolaceae bacterium]|nr:sigma-70 family RNA polymerase sigma factor [Balneolaceae bacterium]